MLYILFYNYFEKLKKNNRFGKFGNKLLKKMCKKTDVLKLLAEMLSSKIYLYQKISNQGN